MVLTKNPKETILRDCIKCEESIERDNKLHCKIKIKDLNLPFTCYSEVTVKRKCGYFREKR